MGIFAGGVLGGTSAAAIALFIAYADRRSERRRKLEYQTQRVSAWLCFGHDVHPNPSTSPLVLTFANSSDDPVYDFRIRIIDPKNKFVPSSDGPVFDCFDPVRPPGPRVIREDITNLKDLSEKHGASEICRELQVEVFFSDSGGQHWHRAGALLKKVSSGATP